MKVLIVDDDLARTKSLMDFLIAENVVAPQGIYTSSNMDDAVVKLKSFHFDVVILDVVIPKRDRETANSKWAFSLLYKISRSQEIKKPSKIIGITGYLEDLGEFRQKFEEYCLVVIEANRTTARWRGKIAEYIGYDILAQAHRAIANEPLNVITIHGIRTFGEWQNRLRDITHSELAPIPFHGYRYGYMSFLALFSKSSHEKYIGFLRTRLQAIVTANSGVKFVFFAHSFGTFLLVETLRRMCGDGQEIPIKTVVLSGSVLKSDYDLSFLVERGIQIVNDCADGDYVLWLSEAFVPGLGMAGKVGFYGFENKALVNRFYLGGHSNYFKGNEFLRSEWLPIIGGIAEIKSVDHRTSSALVNDVIEEIIITVGKIKDALVGKARYVKRNLSGK